jgi:16S rRNA (guanine527-N7)-methyltransferase
LSSSAHAPALRALGLETAAVARLSAYLDVLAHWSSRTNLTAARNPTERVELLVAPILAGLPWLRPGRLLDVGSGNGSPGLVLALLVPELRVTLLEPRLKRWAFLREALRSLGRLDVEVLRERLEAYSGPPADTLTLRALTLEAGALASRVGERGRVLVWGRPLAGACPALVERLRGEDLQVYERVSRETEGGDGPRSFT